MAADSQTFMIVQLLIASIALLCISLAYVWFLRHKLKKQQSRKSHVFEYAYDGARAGKTDESTLSDTEKLGHLSGEQLYIGSQLHEMTSEKDIESLSEKERLELLQKIDALEESLQRSGKQIASMKVQYRQVNCDLENEENKVSDLKKVVEAQYTTDVESDDPLLEANQKLKDDLAKKEKEIKKLRVNSSLMTKELDDLKLDNLDTYELKQSLDETEQKLKRSEAERELLESKFVELAEGRSTKDLEEEISRMKKEYEMLEQRFIGSGAA